MSGVNFESLLAQAAREIEGAADTAALEALRVKYLGRKGSLAALTASIPSLPVDERAAFGRDANALKASLVEAFDREQRALKEGAQGSRAAAPGVAHIDLPGLAQEVGSIHPLTQVIDEICALFTRMGFSVVEGPEIETEYNNFTGLNIPLEHPSRDAFDTFYLKQSAATGDRLLLRSHTSPVQVRAMKAQRPPFAVVVPGRVYRPDAADASHSCMFHQIEGFMVDTHITFADLKGVLEVFAKGVFGDDITMRFRPHFFPFTEPSAEVDISCIICKGKGCPVCGRKGWLEILGSGMIHPNVLRNCGHDPARYSGFAFGMGVERIAMLKYGIDDIRLFFENDMRFLHQF